MKKLITLLSFLVFAVALRAEPVKITNRQADELLGALMSIEDGLTAANFTIVADNINELRPKVEAYSKGNNVAFKRHKIAAGVTKTDDPEFIAYSDEIEVNQNAQVTVDLSRLNLPDEEIMSMKVRAGVAKPSVLAILRLYLKPGAKK